MVMPIDPAALSFSRLASQVWYWPVVRGVLAILAGIVAWAWPGATAVVIVLAIGVLAVVDGIVEIVHGIRYRSTPAAGLHLVVGFIGLGVGLLLLFWPGKSAEFLAWCIGLWVLLAGLLQSAAAWSLRSTSNSGWGWGLFAGLLGIVFGLLVLFNVRGGIVSIVWIIALWAIMRGVLLIAAGFTVRSLGRQAA